MGRVTALSIAAVAAITVAVGVASPATADEGEAIMPDLQGQSLEDAEEMIASLDPGFEIYLHASNKKGYPQKPKAGKMWEVCDQAPAPGETITAESWVGVGVVRTGQSCWG